MFYGRFGDTSGRPYVEGRLSIPTLGIVTNISFLVDTGADTTCLMPMDALKASLDYSALTNATTSVGVGGAANNFTEPAFVVFNNEGVLIIYKLQLTIFPPGPNIMDVPSLLGRDVIDRFNMVYAPSNDELSFDPVSFDESLTLKT